jgi:hypothetical protein
VGSEPGRSMVAATESSIGGIVHTVARLGKYPAKRRSVVVVRGRTPR